MGVWAQHSFNKDCPQSFPGPAGPPKEPTRGPTFSQNFCVLFFGPRFLESRPSWESNPSTPWLFGGFKPNLRSTKIASRASQSQRDPPRSPQEDRHFHKKTVYFFWPRFLKSRASWGAVWSTAWPDGRFAANIRPTKIARKAPRGP